MKLTKFLLETFKKTIFVNCHCQTKFLGHFPARYSKTSFRPFIQLFSFSLICKSWIPVLKLCLPDPRFTCKILSLLALPSPLSCVSYLCVCVCFSVESDLITKLGTITKKYQDLVSKFPPKMSFEEETESTNFSFIRDVFISYKLIPKAKFEKYWFNNGYRLELNWN